MNTAPPPRPPPAHAEPPQGTLEERIARAEQGLVAREQALQQRAQAFMQRTQEALEPRRLVRPAAYTAGTLVLVWVVLRLLRRKPDAAGVDPRATAPASTARSAAEGRAPASPLRDLPWARTAALLWPLLPVAWRGRLGPDTASIIVTLGLTLVGLLFSKRVRKR
jgi:hypothetical protein